MTGLLTRAFVLLMASVLAACGGGGGDGGGAGNGGGGNANTSISLDKTTVTLTAGTSSQTGIEFLDSRCMILETHRAARKAGPMLWSLRA